MILEFSIENFLSFKEKVTFSMIANETKGLEDNYVTVKNLKILKLAAVYGANGSGKSNLFAALERIILMIRKSNYFDINDKIPIIPFEGNESSDTRFEIRFIKNSVKYVYGFSANCDEVLEEYLYSYPNGRQTLIFDRKGDSYDFPQTEKKILNQISKMTSKNKFFLNTATNWNYDRTKEAYDFITSDIAVYDDIEHLAKYSQYLYVQDPSLKKLALKILKQADFNIVDFEVNCSDIPLDINNSVESLISSLNKLTFYTKFKHKFDDKDYMLDFYVESLGTQILFILIPWLSLAFRKNRVLIIDELDRSLHPFILKYIISLFNDSKINKFGSQLIFNTHDTNLLDLEIMRRDQIWFVEKNFKSGSSDLYSLSDFNIRKDDNIEKGYILGRYGAIPFIKFDEELWQEK